MSSMHPIASPSSNGVTIPFRDRYPLSPHFQALFQKGMALVEETADYLDGPGREEAKRLKPALTLAYATESMRLTTRLMQLASWLLLRRAVNRGELSADQAATSKHKVPLVPIGRSTKTQGYDELPQHLRELVEASLSLHDRIVRLDRMIHDDMRGAEQLPQHPVDAQWERIRSAFKTA
jgi:regulator of CtrA degradation